MDCRDDRLQQCLTIDKGIKWEEDEEAYNEFEQFDFEQSQSFQTGWSTLSNIVDTSKSGFEYLKAKVFFFSKYHKLIDIDKYKSWKEAKFIGSNGTREADKDAPGECQQPSAEKGKEIDSNSHCDKSDFSPMGNDKSMTKEVANSSPLNNLSCDNLSTLLQSTSLDSVHVTNANNTDAESKTDSVNSRNDEVERECVAEGGQGKADISITSGSRSQEDAGTFLSLLDIASFIQRGLPIPGLVSLDVQPTNQKPTPSSQERKMKPWEKSVTDLTES